MTVIIKSLCQHFRAFISADQMAEVAKEIEAMFDRKTSIVGYSGGTCTDLGNEVGLDISQKMLNHDCTRGCASSTRRLLLASRREFEEASISEFDVSHFFLVLQICPLTLIIFSSDPGPIIVYECHPLTN